MMFAQQPATMRELFPRGHNVKLRIFLIGLLALASVSQAATLVVKNELSEPLPQVMVTRTPASQPEADLSDDGYTPHGVTNTAASVITRAASARPCPGPGLCGCLFH